MGNMKETHNVFLKFSFQKHPLCFHGKNPLEIKKNLYKWVFLGETPPSASSVMWMEWKTNVEELS